MIKYFILLIKGIFIGTSVMIPGLSGGTVAIILGVYEQILESTAEYFRNVKKNTFILLTIISGAVLGAFLIAKPLEICSKAFPLTSKTIFCFIALLSLFFFLRRSLNGIFKLHETIYVLLGMLPAFLVSLTLQSTHLSIENRIFLFPVGVLLATALVLPAISFSYMLLFFGIYEDCLNALNSLDFSFIIILGAGVIAGILLCAKVFLYFIRRTPRATYLIIAGFVLYSVFDIII